MKVTEDGIDYNAMRLIDKLVDGSYDIICEEEFAAGERGLLLMTLGEIRGIVSLAKELKVVIRT